MNKLIKIGFISSLLIASVALNFSKTDQDVFSLASSGNLSELVKKVENDPSLLSSSDKNGFTLFDYARMSQKPETLQWLKMNKVNSGIDKELIQRIQLWFILLNIPGVSDRLHVQGVYDEALQNAILNYRTTRGLPKSIYITPDWYTHLEEDGIRTLQRLFFDEDEKSEITGHWNPNSQKKLMSFKKESGLPETEMLSLTDILAIKKAYANSLANLDVEEISDLNGEAIAENVIADKGEETEQKGADETLEIQTETDVVVDSSTETTIPDATQNENPKTTGILISADAQQGKVLTLQVWLTLAGFPAGEIDGKRGELTRQAIKDYETSIGLKPTGILSAKWEAPLEKTIWMKVQEKLKELNLYSGDADGIPGTATVQALKAYEKSKGLPETAELTTDTLVSIFNEGQLVSNEDMEDEAVPTDTQEEDAIIAEEGGDEEASATIVENTEEDNDSFQPGTVDAIKAMTETNETSTTYARFIPKGEKDIVKHQLILHFLGYYQGDIDGLDSDLFTESVKAFQEKNNVEVDGKLGRNTFKVLETEGITKLQEFFQKEKLLEDQTTGTLGPKTRRIIANLHKEHGIPAPLNDRTLDIGTILIALDKERNSNYVKIYLAVLEQERIERERIQKMQEYLIALGYLSDSANGKMTSATQKALDNFRKEEKISSEEDSESLLVHFDKATVKKVQSQLNKLGYSLTADGLRGPKTTKTIETFQKKYKFKVTGLPNLETLFQVNERIVAANRRAPVTEAIVASESTKPVKGVMPNLSRRAGQIDRVLSAEPSNTIKGRLQMVYNSKGTLAGCKVNNITMAARWCESFKSNQACRVLYKNGRVLSIRCR